MPLQRVRVYEDEHAAEGLQHTEIRMAKHRDRPCAATASPPANSQDARTELIDFSLVSKTFLSLYVHYLAVIEYICAIKRKWMLLWKQDRQNEKLYTQ